MSNADLRRANLISIHAPREGCDWPRPGRTARPRAFQSTHPVRGATPGGTAGATRKTDFNPRTP